MKILFLTTAHNSLSQSLYIALSPYHDISIEYALSSLRMIEAVSLCQPDLIICPFLTNKVPEEIYAHFMTLIIHPGPPCDAGPSALDWVLMGDDGNLADSKRVLEKLDAGECSPRRFWGVSVIQATEKFDAGPIWAFEQFPINIDEPGLTKSSLYRGPVTRAVIDATTTAILRLEEAQGRQNASTFSGFSTYESIESSLAAYSPSEGSTTPSEWSTTKSAAPSIHESPPPSRRTSRHEIPHIGHTSTRIDVHLVPKEEYASKCVGAYKPFLGGKTHDRPLLKAADRDFDVHRHTANQISRRIRCADSQPGVLTKNFGTAVYICGGKVDDLIGLNKKIVAAAKPGDIIATRYEAILIKTVDLKGIWITHTRRLKRKGKDTSLWPKVTAVFGLIELGILNAQKTESLNWDIPVDGSEKWALSRTNTFQEVWIDRDEASKIAYVYFDFYNGAMSTRQCKLLLDAIKYAVNPSSSDRKTEILVMMGGAYFSNGVALNVIEASSNAGQESWESINAIDDIIEYVINIGRDQKILTVAGVRGNAAAGGVAMFAACDYVICGHDVVLNPAYRAVGLYGSEFHTLTYYGRCGPKRAHELLHDMLPISPYESGGLVDKVVEAHGPALEAKIRGLVAGIAKSKDKTSFVPAWKKISKERVKAAREEELGEMKLDFWGPRSRRFHERRSDFVRKVKPERTPLRFAKHRREDGVLDLEEREEFDEVVYWEGLAGTSASNAKVVEQKTESNAAEVKEGLFACYYNPV